jgi:hypothetical protein
VLQIATSLLENELSEIGILGTVSSLFEFSDRKAVVHGELIAEDQVTATF